MSKMLTYIIALWCTSFSITANESPFKRDLRGIISPVFQSEVLQSGDHFDFHGNICFTRGRTHSKCVEEARESFEFKAYFPDLATEVTDQVKLTFNKTTNKYDYFYRGENLSADRENQLTVIIGTESEHVRNLSLAKTRLVQLKKWLEQRLTAAYKVKWRVLRDFLVNMYQKLIARTDESLVKIDAVINEAPEVLAKATVPLKVENNPSSQLFVSSQVTGYRVSLAGSEGVVTSGQSIDGQLDLMRIDQTASLYPHYVSVKVGNEVLLKRHKLDLDFSEKFSFNFQKKLGEGKNVGAVIIERKTLSGRYKKLGLVTTSFVGLKDDVAPTINLQEPIDREIVQSDLASVTFSGEISDRFGTLGPEALAVTINGEENVNGVDVEWESTRIGRGQFMFTGEVTPLIEGHYQVLVSGRDESGNEAASQAFSLIVDATAPVVKFAQSSDVYTKNPQFDLDVDIIDVSRVDSILYVNEQEKFSSDSSSFSFTANLLEGANKFRVLATDVLGNKGEAELLNIVLDTTAPLIGLNVSNDQIFDQRDFNLTGVVTERNVQKTIVTFNGDEVFSAATNSITVPLTFRAGANILNVTVTDLAGNSTSVNYSLTYNQPVSDPVAMINVSETTIDVGESIRFDGSSSQGGSSAINRYRFAFSSGEVVTQESPSLTRTFPVAGEYSVVLTVTNNEGAQAQARADFVVNELPTGPMAKIDCDRSGFKLTCDSKKSSAGLTDELASVSWSTSDGGTGQGPYFEHTFPREGVYTVSLRLTTKSGVILTEEEEVTVNIVTNLYGRVLDATAATEKQILPIEGAIVRLIEPGLEVRTDERGIFEFKNLPRGSSFTFEVVCDEAIPNPNGFRYAAFREKLPLSEGIDNVITRPFFMPRIDETLIKQIDPTTTVTLGSRDIGTIVVDGSTVTKDGRPYSGPISMSMVPAALVPASFPSDLSPTDVFTIQPAGLRFSTPLAVTMPNSLNYIDGTKIDLWQVSPDTGVFTVVGEGEVFGDEIRTVSGGITMASWGAPIVRVFIRDLIDTGSLRNNVTPNYPNSLLAGSTKNTPPLCGVGSDLELRSGTLLDDHKLFSYRSLNQRREVSLLYNSKLARPHTITEQVVTTTGGGAGAAAFKMRSYFGEVLGSDLMTPEERAQELAGEGSPGVFVTFTNGGVDSVKRSFADVSRYRSGIKKQVAEVAVVNLDRNGDVASTPGGRWVNVRCRIGESADACLARISSSFESSSVSQETRVQSTFDNVMHVSWRDSIFGAGFNLEGWSRIYLNDNRTSLMLEEDNGDAYLFTSDPNNRTRYIHEGTNYSVFNVLTDGRYRRIFKDGSFAIYRDDGQLETTSDANGNKVTYQYNNGQLSSVTDPVGLTTQFFYDETEKVSRIVDPFEREVRMERNEAGSLVRLIQVDGSVISFEYNRGQQITGKTDERGHKTSYEYDFMGRVVRIVRPDSSEMSIIELASTSGVVEPQVDSEGNIQGSIDNPIVTSVGYNFRSTFLFDGKGTSLEASYGQRNINTESLDSKFVRIRNPILDGSNIGKRGSSAKSYNEQGLLIKEDIPTYGRTIREEQNTISYEYIYNDFGEVIETKKLLDRVPDINYFYEYPPLVTLEEGIHKPIKVTNNKGEPRLEMSYDGRGNLTSLSQVSDDDSLSLTSTVQYNDRGQVVQMNDESNVQTFLAYNEQGQLVALENGLGDRTEFFYDERGNTISLTDGRGQETLFGYDVKNRLIAVTAANNSTTNFDYDEGDNLTGVVDELGNRTTFDYDTRSRLSSITDPWGKTETRQYDENGNLSKVITRKGDVIDYTYESGNTLREVLINGSSYAKYRRDSYTKVLHEMEDEENFYRYSSFVSFTATRENVNRKEGGRICQGIMGYTGRAINGYSASCSFNGEGKGSLQHDYGLDQLLRVISNQVSLGNSGSSNGAFGGTLYHYDQSQLASTNYRQSSTQSLMNNFAEMNFAYDNAGRLSSLLFKGRLGDESSLLMSHGITYDKVSNKTKIEKQRVPSSLNPTINISYDEVSQLTSASSVLRSGAEETYEYDKLGNRVRENGFTNVIGAGNRLLEDSKFKYTYDDNGNTSSKENKTSGEFTYYTWDALNQLTKVEKATSSTSEREEVVSYKYDPLGRRGSRIVNGQRTDFLYHGDKLLAEVREDGTFVRGYIHMPETDRVEGFIENNRVYYFIRDELGNVTDIFDGESMSIAQSYAYDSFGNMRVFDSQGTEVALDNAPFKQPFTFTSREYDFDSELYYYRARYYNSQTGRFMSEDPIGFAGGDVNLYRYVQNNPTNLTDPTGKNPFLLAVGVGALIGGAGGVLGDFIGNDNFSFQSATSAFLGGAAGGATAVALAGAAIVGGASSGLAGAGAAIGGLFIGAGVNLVTTPTAVPESPIINNSKRLNQCD